ncbi:MarR family transcriptional regulator [Hyphomonas sp. BRH_c22]|uniref:MarR family winged helix-turn-helix transcriptional regulator n=1 Tax=Hyphomonas sp. BRH_c22 TaxID=1629710 RepID=UPI0005F1C4F5|nr:MarR family transcriptional regulator [Hyphomonas sp. BRH_c22]
MNQRSVDALIALRKIQRVTELASRRLASTAGLTPSQLAVLRLLEKSGELSSGRISEATLLKQATITSLADKLEARELIARRRCDEDRRRVWLRLLPAGVAVLADAPDLLQETFSDRFNDLPDWQQSLIVSALEQVSGLLDADDLDAAPALDVGELDEAVTG